MSAAGLVTAAGALEGVPHVTGVRTITGERLEGDLVVDAMGRRSPMDRWLAHIGARPPYVEAEEWRFVYHTRYFRGGDLPRMTAPPLSELGTVSLLTLPGDNGTWSVTVWAASSDTALRGLRDPAKFSAVVAACPLHAHWLGGDPITGMLTMAGSLDRYHRFLIDGRPVATGVASVGDAWACTNPSAGRGMTVGLIHARRLRDVVASGLQDPVSFAHAWDEVTRLSSRPSTGTRSKRTGPVRLRWMPCARATTPLRPIRPPPPSLLWRSGSRSCSVACWRWRCAWLFRRTSSPGQR